MTSALIVLDDESAHLRVFGLEWLDYVIRRMALEGISHVVVVVEQIPRALGEILDRARRHVVSCTVARATVELADLFHPQEAVLLIGGTRLFDPKLLHDLSKADGEYLLCTRDGSARPFERIDAETWWTGLASVSGARVRAMSAAPGDWNAASLLMRLAVQAGVDRQFVLGSIVIDASDTAGIAAFEATSIRTRMSPSEGWGSRFIVEPIARLLAGLLAHRLASAAMIAWPLALALSLIAILLAFAPLERRAAVAAACIVLAKIGCAIARCGASVTASSSRPALVVRSIVDGAAGAVLVALAMPVWKDPALLVLAVIVVAFTWLCRRGVVVLSSPPPWWADIGGHTLLFALTVGLSPSLFAPALVLAAAHSFLCLVWLQDRVSELLRSRR